MLRIGFLISQISLLEMYDVLSIGVQYILYRSTVDKRDRAKHLGCITTPKYPKMTGCPDF